MDKNMPKSKRGESLSRLSHKSESAVGHVHGRSSVKSREHKGHGTGKSSAEKPGRVEGKRAAHSLHGGVHHKQHQHGHALHVSRGGHE